MLERQQLTLDPAEVSIVNLDFCRTLKTAQTGEIPP
jgi:hypothetical protein